VCLAESVFNQILSLGICAFMVVMPCAVYWINFVLLRTGRWSSAGWRVSVASASGVLAAVAEWLAIHLFLDFGPAGEGSYILFLAAAAGDLLLLIPLVAGLLWWLRRTGSFTPSVLAVGAMWFVFALLTGYFGLLAQVPRPVVQVVLFALTGALLAGYALTGRFRDWVNFLDLRALLAIHLSRFVGIYFLVLYQRGELPFAFAVPGGWGDIVIATGAVILILCPAVRLSLRWPLIVWNIAGLIDILFVIFTAARLGLAQPESMRALVQLPLVMLPTFIVPLIVASHVIIYLRVRRREG
jgi:hypothetical protein